MATRVLLLALAAALQAPRAARGVSWGSTLAPATAEAPARDGEGAQEVVSISALNGSVWNPMEQLHPQNHPEVLNFRIQLESRSLIVHLERNDGLIARGFTETHYQQDGTLVSLTRNHTGHCHYHGHVRGHPGSSVSLSACSGLRGLLTFDNQTYVLAPAGSAPSGYALSPAQALLGFRGSCGSHDHPADPRHPPPSPTPARRRKRETLKMTKYVELVIVADNREFQRQGRDLEKVKQRLLEIANHVDKFYRPLNIRIVLVGVEVWTDIDKCPISQDPFTSLHEFLDWRKMKLLPRKSHDNAQLVSGVYFQGTTIGMAPIMSMCTAEQSGGVVMDHSDSPLGAAVTLAHELGHNFGMNHDTLERGCSCRTAADKGGCIMSPSTGFPFPMAFSSCSRKDLEASLEKGMGMCLFNLPEVKPSFGGQKCGNGYVEEGEECDCGEPEECTNLCCNASSCTLKPEAVCAHGLCCEDCRLKPAGTACRGSGNSCDLPEFCTGASPHCPANVYLHDGHPCQGVDGYCYNGVCQTHEQQCVTLWGPGAKPAPGVCFERVNSAGDPYGNCGKDSKSSFAKCEARDAKCGKIQCQGGASRPVIGTNAVSIETNIPLQEGGRILCRGTHVYLGDDLPDPGLVLAGTKCADGKICLSRRCQNVTVFGVHTCAQQCHGRGVCNNRKNCHCEPRWAPPFCDRLGFGGSTDSGPIRQAAGHRGDPGECPEPAGRGLRPVPQEGDAGPAALHKQGDDPGEAQVRAPPAAGQRPPVRLGPAPRPGPGPPEEAASGQRTAGRSPETAGLLARGHQRAPQGPRQPAAQPAPASVPAPPAGRGGTQRPRQAPARQPGAQAGPGSPEAKPPAETAACGPSEQAGPAQQCCGQAPGPCGFGAPPAPHQTCPQTPSPGATPRPGLQQVRRQRPARPAPAQFALAAAPWRGRRFSTDSDSLPPKPPSLGSSELPPVGAMVLG
ncbi:disintegrin and metalloproteinase domain-containing protein 12 isoform X1 [Sorex araneus]|uniref:disintegrin and metalloproteinase domain-containing protein 12 isoform X1 n=1 Tax=Sorex araneus TaxID=42254 RepID=UPI0024337725|nr:disintegrin and metalloproteinase domain-containing protein 12 isoform X1 [Sorex araneus]